MTNIYDVSGLPIGTTDPRAAANNRSNLDEFLNSSASTFTDRLGALRKTLAAVQAILDATSLPAMEAIRDDISAALLADDAAYATLADIEAIVSPTAGDVAYTYSEPATNNPLFYRYDGAAWVELWDPNALNAAFDSRLSALEPISERGSIAFSGLNGFYQSESGYVSQSVTGIPQFFQHDTTLITRMSMPWQVLSRQAYFYATGSGFGSQGNSWMVRFVGGQSSLGIRNSWEFAVTIGSGGGVALTATAAMTEYPDDVCIVVRVGDDESFLFEVYDVVTGSVVASAATTMAATTGIPWRYPVFVIGGTSETGVISVAAPSITGFWPGDVAEYVYHGSRLSDTDVADVVVNGYFKSAVDSAGAIYARDFSRSDYLSAFTASDTSADSALVGTAKDGSTVGFSGGVSVAKKSDGFVAGIVKNARAAWIDFDILTDGVVTGAITADIVCGGGVVKTTAPLAVAVAGTTSYNVRFSMPVTPDWCRIVFRVGDAVHYYNRRVAAGVKVAFVGQSQVNYLKYTTGGLTDTRPRGPVSYVFRSGTSIAAVYPYETTMRVVSDVNLSDGVVGFAHHFFRHADVPVCIVLDAVPGTGVDQLLNDGLTERLWSWQDDMLRFSGSDFSAIVYNWGTNNLAAAENFGEYVMTPLTDGIPSSMVPTIDHFLYDGVTFSRDMQFILSPLTGHRDTVVGPLDRDVAYGGQAGRARDSQIAWAAERGYAIGPFVNDLPTGGPHQYLDTPKGNWRFGVRMAESVLRGMGYSDRKNPSVKSCKFADIGRTVIDVTFKLPNGGALQTDGNSFVWGFEWTETDENGRSRTGFDAAVLNSRTVRLTKTSGSWSPSVKISYLYGGPFSYGTSISEYETTSGQLYDGVGMDGTVIGDNLGTPVGGSNALYTVAAYAG